MIRGLLRVIVGFAITGFAITPALAERLASYAFVNDDGSLRIRGRTVQLFGILIPTTEATCRPTRPPECGSRAALALQFKMGAHFVHCDVKSIQPDRRVIALCRVNGEDLSAYLLRQGWAAALPDAPPDYVVLERIARERGIGIWGVAIEPQPLKRLDAVR